MQIQEINDCNLTHSTGPYGENLAKGSSVTFTGVAAVNLVCKGWWFATFIYLVRVPLSLRQRLEEASRLVFAQSPTLVPLTSDEHDDRLTQWSNPSPQYSSNFRIIMQEYIEEMEKLAYKLLELVTLSLGVEAKFEEFFKDQTSIIRFDHYPPCPYPQLALGVGRNKDAGAVTILAQDEVEGLEVKRKTDQQWVLVKPTRDAYIINVGAIIQVWSNDAYEIESDGKL
ncbi:gibberellin 20 oxidase 1-like protein [Trifolium pratense]|uniref:Gibberellin 20 oxidase 1-like protein n=1 Tax=Trifolium pratense TaxID=57577 RepID=A0A2K3MXS0_TRIPR|nr:gibberellin 20 oxidase 1-like protein [Trifolium pratense]